MSFKNELDIFYGLFKQHVNGVQKATLRWVTCKEVDWDNGTMTAADEDGREYFRVMLGTASVIIKPKVETDCLIGIVHGHEEMTFLISANEVDLIVYNGGDNGGFINIEQLVSKVNLLEDAYNDLASKYNAHVHPVPGITPGAGAVTSSATTSLETTVITKTVKADLEDTKITH